MNKYIKRVVDNLLYLRNTNVSLKELAFGIEWLIVDKFIDDEETRNNLCNSLGDRMRLVEEYGDRKEKQGVKTGIQIGERNIIRDMYENGASIQMIADLTGKSVPIVNEILKG